MDDSQLKRVPAVKPIKRLEEAVTGDDFGIASGKRLHVDFPIDSMVIFYSYVKLPEGTLW